MNFLKLLAVLAFTVCAIPFAVAADNDSANQDTDSSVSAPETPAPDGDSD